MNIGDRICFIDYLESEVKDRVCLALPRLKGQYLLPDKLSELSGHSVAGDKRWARGTDGQSRWSWCWNGAVEGIGWYSMQLQWHLWGYKEHGGISPKFPLCTESLSNYASVHASAERSFSILRRLKTRWQTTGLLDLSSWIFILKLKSTARKCLNNSMRPGGGE